jgi:hypothetical protein
MQALLAFQVPLVALALPAQLVQAATQVWLAWMTVSLGFHFTVA